MKKLFFLTSIFLFLIPNIYSNGVGVVDAQNGVYLKLLTSQVEVSVENQVAITTATQAFENTFTSGKITKYAFPLPEGASATGLDWQINGAWHQAKFKAGAQDTTLPGPGGEIHPNLKTYLGDTPLYFTIDDTLKADSILIVRLTYVQLLKYEFGEVRFSYPNNYSLIQSNSLNLQELEFDLISQRTIENISLSSHTPQSLINTGNSAAIKFYAGEAPAVKDYLVTYSLDRTELGLFSMSTSLPDSLVPDSLGRGYFLFIAEPNPAQSSDIIKKVFTLIIDRSGSMYGNKIEQAKSAASFIVQNLNEGDKFNLIDFDDAITSFRPEHVPYNGDNRESALQYISTLNARGMTNISGAFGTAISQFNTANESTANIIIFLTDGQATAGLTNTNDILNYIREQVNSRDTSITIFNFGIGSDVNRQLLTLLASENNGIAEFLENNELESSITSFYLKIQNPVLLNTQMSFNPFTVIETFPSPLPNLYKGQQLLVAGRYLEAAPVTVTLSGLAFGQPVSYDYQLSLSGTNQEKYLFLTKIWAKFKIENLLVKYYSLSQYSPEAEKIKEQIIKISLSYGVLSPFTNLSGGDPTLVDEEVLEIEQNIVSDFHLIGNYPNPFNPGTKIIFKLNVDINEAGTVRIYNMLGELIREINVFINGSGRYEILWDGKDHSGISVPSGSYIYVVSFGKYISAGKMNLMK